MERFDKQWDSQEKQKEQKSMLENRKEMSREEILAG